MERYIVQDIHEWTKENLWKTAFKKFYLVQSWIPWPICLKEKITKRVKKWSIYELMSSTQCLKFTDSKYTGKHVVYLIDCLYITDTLTPTSNKRAVKEIPSDHSGTNFCLKLRMWNKYIQKPTFYHGFQVISEPFQIKSTKNQ